MDQDKDGSVSFSEFVSAGMGESIILKDNNLKKAFEMIDHKSDGFIDKDDLSRAFNAFNGTSENQMDDIWREFIGDIDKDADGKITFEQFSEAMTKQVTQNQDKVAGALV